MKKIKIAVCAGTLAMGLLAGQMAFAEEEIDTAALEMHKIGVVVYNIGDEQVQSFREYLEGYIEECFPDVDFIYSGSVNNEEQEMQFLQDAADAGVEGILSFNSYDLQAEVELCAANQIYYLRASSSITDEDYEKVCDNPYYLGNAGPGIEMEYEAGYQMGEHFANMDAGNEYFIMSGGAPFGVAMHLERTRGILDGLAAAYGVEFEEDTAALAASMGSAAAQAGDLKVCIVSGFMDSEDFLEAAQEAYEQNPYGVVLSVNPVGEMAESIKGAKLGVIDCYSVGNLQLFISDRLQYVTGKYNSIIGPSFALMYNALSGDADVFREADGKAVRMVQGFWTSDNQEDYANKYALSAGVALNAYSVDDLISVIKRFTPDATLQDLKDLAEAYTFEDALARRGMNQE